MAINKTGESRARNQVVTPRSTRRVANSRPSRRRGVAFRNAVLSIASFGRPIAGLVLLALLIIGYNVIGSSELFELHRVEVPGVSQTLSSEIEQRVKRFVGQERLLDLNLEAVRQKVEELTRVRNASVARVLPDGILVRVIERQPSVLVRRQSGVLVWLDEEAVELGEVSELTPGSEQSGGPKEIPPVLIGFSEGAKSNGATAEDRERIGVYREIERELIDGEAPIWNLVDEIDLTYTRNVNVRVAGSIVRVVIGSKDFRNRFETALKIIKAINDGDAEMLARYRVRDPERLIRNANNINFIDTARPDRIVISFSTPGKEKSTRQDKK